MRGVKDGETEKKEQAMPGEDKKDNTIEDIVDLGEAEIMEAMSFKKLRAKLDHKKKYFVEYKNKKNNFVSTITTGKEPK